jgi:MOSC domain-containing protein
MEKIGRVAEIWRYPVKSMAGERLDRCAVGVRGIPGDRGWALRDEKAGEIRGAKKMPALMKCQAHYVSEPSANEIPPAEITLPDGSKFKTGAPDANQQLSNLLGRPVTLWPTQPENARDFYRRSAPDNPDMIQELREIFGRLENEPLPDLTMFGPEILEFTSPLGTYFDVMPFHLVTTATIAKLRDLTPGANIDSRRFRPNLLIETNSGMTGLVEADWNGRTVRIGDARIKVEMPCARCVMTTLEQIDLAKDPSVLRTIVRDADQNVGSYCTVVGAGKFAVGDEVALE